MTTPKVRAAIQASNEPARVLAERRGTTEQIVWKWRKRDGTEDHSHRPPRSVRGRRLPASFRITALHANSAFI